MTTPSSPVPAQVAGYTVVRVLGRGGNGTVYEARRASDGTPAAVKLLHATVVDVPTARRYRREVESLETLRHPHVVELYESGVADEGLFVAMELCRGGSVGDVVDARPGGAVAPREAVRIALEALSGLAHVHARGFAHRDIKPANVLLTAAANGTAKIGDFGLARFLLETGASRITATGAVSGTPEFMPRELVTDFKYAPPATDVWSLGATLYYLLTGRTPRDFPREVSNKIGVVLFDPVVPLAARAPALPAPLIAVVDRALEEEPDDRYADAAAFREALAAAAAESGLLAST